jgi:predicted nucleic acid-binding protein
MKGADSIMPFVLDASVVGNWFMPDEAQHPHALEAWERIALDDAFVPVHWWFEVRNFMLVAERKERFSDRYTAAALERLARMQIVEAPRAGDAGIFGLARRHQLSFYDAAYLELAKRENMSLATLDSRLAEAAIAEGVTLIGVS